MASLSLSQFFNASECAQYAAIVLNPSHERYDELRTLLFTRLGWYLSLAPTEVDPNLHIRAWPRQIEIDDLLAAVIPAA